MPPFPRQNNPTPPAAGDADPQSLSSAEGDAHIPDTPRPDDGAAAPDDVHSPPGEQNDPSGSRGRHEPDIGPRGSRTSGDRADHRSFRSIAIDELTRRGEFAILKGMERLADTCDDTAHRIQRLATLRGGPAAASFGPVTSTMGGLEGAADYLRGTDLDGVRTDLRSRVRSRPVQTLGIALCVGWITGRILR